MSKQNSVSSSENSDMQIADYFIILLSKKRRAANLGKSVTPHKYVHTTYNISFHVFGSMFVSWCIVFVEIQSYLHSDKMCWSEKAIFLQ